VVSELVHALGGEEVLEAVLTEVAKVTVHERGRRLRHEHLPSVTRSCDAGGAMDVNADVAFVGDERSPGVKAYAYLHRTGRERRTP
jgi:hypothetical protein